MMVVAGDCHRVEDSMKMRGWGAHLTWRAAVVAAACIAVSTLVSADGQKTVLLGLPELLPDIEFSGFVDYDHGAHLDFTGSTMYSTDKKGVPFAIILISGVSPLPPRPVSDTDQRLVCDQADGDWVTDSLFVAKDRDGTLKCLHDAGWGRVQFWADVYPLDQFQPLEDVSVGTPPQFREETPSPDACGLDNGDNFCVSGTVVTCDDPPLGGDIHACTGQDPNHPVGNRWTLVTDAGDPSQNPPILVRGRVSYGLRPQVLAASHSYVGQYGLDVLEVVTQVTGGALANQYPPISSSDPRQIMTMQLVLQLGANSSDLLWDWTKSFQQWTHNNYATHMYATDGSNP